MHIDTSFLQRCVQTLERSLELLNNSDKESIEYDMYRLACVRKFEIILEQSQSVLLLKKALKPYFHSSKEADRLYFKDIFRHAENHSLITTEETERWMKYRDNRNSTAHDYGAGFAEKTLNLLPLFIIDAQSVIKAIQSVSDA